ncbi:MAG: DUF3606 domain-containing protein [Betaproteobacteria bacterium]|nr:DUF3606 domain-containing protein [Betaproteobacteria bacterium]
MSTERSHAHRNWCAEFKCTEAQLVAAVRATGVMVADVRRHLSK